MDPMTRIVVLQYDDCAAELAEITSRGCVRPLVPPGLDRRDDLDGMAALIVALDGVLSAETAVLALAGAVGSPSIGRSEEHTSELQSLMRISYAVFCLKKKKQQKYIQKTRAR